jgi:hypothetical protein
MLALRARQAVASRPRRTVSGRAIAFRPAVVRPRRAETLTAHAVNKTDPDDGEEGNPTLQGVAGGCGCAAAIIVLISSYKLATTGDGLPAGPGGLYGAAEGLSYLGVVAIVLASAVKKAKTGSGLPGAMGRGGGRGVARPLPPTVCLSHRLPHPHSTPKTAGPSGLLGAAEGFSYLAVLAAIGAFGYTAATTGGVPGPLG